MQSHSQAKNDYCYFGIITVGFWSQHSNKIINFDERGQVNRVCTGHGKPGKSWNLSISDSRPGKSWNLIVGHGEWYKNYFRCRSKD